MGIYKAFPLLKRKFPELNPFNIYEVGVNKNTGELLKNIHKFTVESKETKLKYILRKDKKLQQGKIICMKKSPGNQNWEEIKNFDLPIKQYAETKRIYLCFMFESEKKNFILVNNVMELNGKKVLKNRIKNYATEVSFPFGGITKNGFVCQFNEKEVLVEFRKDEGSFVKSWVPVKALIEYNPSELQKKVNKNYLAGLRNYSQNCYINSVIQCIIRTPLFGQYLQKQSIKYNEENLKKLIIYEIYQIYLQSKKINIIETKELKRSIENHFPIFQGSNHQDAQELLNSMLSKLSQEIKSQQEYKRDQTQNIIDNLDGSKNKRIVQFFSGVGIKETQCFLCQNKTQRIESFFTYQLSLPEYKEEEIFFTFIPRVKNKMNPISYGITLWKKISNQEFIDKASELIGKNKRNLYFVYAQNGEWMGKLLESPEAETHSYKQFDMNILCYEVTSGLESEILLVERNSLLSVKVQVQVRRQIAEGNKYEFILDKPFIVEVTNETIWADTKLQIQEIISKHKSPEMIGHSVIGSKNGKQDDLNFDIRIISKQKQNNKCLLCKSNFKSFVKKQWIWESVCDCEPYEPKAHLIKRKSFFNNYNNIAIVVDFSNPKVIKFPSENLLHESYHAAVSRLEKRVDYLEQILQRNFENKEQVQLRCEVEDCKGLRAKRVQRISIFPNILILQLMRFRYKESGMVKINNNVLYPEEFSYRNLRYFLYAVVVHKGTCNGGHYYSFVKCDNNWFKCNDEVVTVDKKEEYKNTDAYLLFYTKSDFEPSLQSLRL